MIRTRVLVAVFGALALGCATSTVADARPTDRRSVDVPTADEVTATVTERSAAVASPTGRAAERRSSSVGVATPLGKVLAIVLATTGLVRLGRLKQQHAERRRPGHQEEERPPVERRRPGHSPRPERQHRAARDVRLPR